MQTDQTMYICFKNTKAKNMTVKYQTDKALLYTTVLNNNKAMNITKQWHVDHIDLQNSSQHELIFLKAFYEK